MRVERDAQTGNGNIYCCLCGEGRSRSVRLFQNLQQKRRALQISKADELLATLHHTHTHIRFNIYTCRREGPHTLSFDLRAPGAALQFKDEIEGTQGVRCCSKPNAIKR